MYKRQLYASVVGSHTRAGEVDGCGRYGCFVAFYSFILVCLFLLRRSFLGGRPRQGRVTLVAKAVRWLQGAVKGGGRNRFEDYKRVRKCGELECVFSVVK